MDIADIIKISPPSLTKGIAVELLFNPKEKYDIAVIGGAGHIGLPMSLVFAKHGKQVLIHDLNQDTMNQLIKGDIPFIEHDAPELLEEALENGRLSMSSDQQIIAKCDTLIVTIGTPVDEFLSPNVTILKRWADSAIPYMRDDQLIVLCSTVFPGTTQWLHDYIHEQGKRVQLAFCPERIVQGHACREVQVLPKLISGVTPEAEAKAAELFNLITPETVPMTPLEAEFAKLFTNSYRYIQFAAANQFYMIAQSAGVDYGKILNAMKHNYDRAKDIPGPGFAAGPCLLKDTMQLAGFAKNQFSLGTSAMQINEGLVLHVVSMLNQRYPLKEMTVGILGMAFKANNDDIRSSLGYKMKKNMTFRAKRVLCSDPLVPACIDPTLIDLDSIIDQSDLLILMTPHSAYKDLDTKGVPIFDLWHLLEESIHI